MDKYKILVTGGAGSGKSACAEKRVLESGIRSRYYLATMRQGADAETKRKIETHRKRRAGNGWTTIEQPMDIARAARQMEEGGAVLLEDLSNLLANEMFCEGTVQEPARVRQHILDGIEVLSRKASLFVIVTNSVFEDGVTYDPETERYLRALAALNISLASEADEVVETVVGIPLRIKGKGNGK